MERSNRYDIVDEDGFAEAEYVGEVYYYADVKPDPCIFGNVPDVWNIGQVLRCYVYPDDGVIDLERNARGTWERPGGPKELNP